MVSFGCKHPSCIIQAQTCLTMYLVYCLTKLYAFLYKLIKSGPTCVLRGYVQCRGLLLCNCSGSLSNSLRLVT